MNHVKYNLLSFIDQLCFLLCTHALVNHVITKCCAGFPYSAGEESIVEVKSKDEYDSCDVGNPTRIYIVGLDGIDLDGEGIRYFVSSKPESCKKGLKLRVELMPLRSPEFPQVTVSESESDTSDWSIAAAPATPSPSVQLYGNFLLLSFGLLLCTCMAV